MDVTSRIRSLLELDPRTTRLIAGVVVFVLVVTSASGIWMRGRSQSDRPDPLPIPGDADDPIVAEVLNATNRSRLARNATRLLREHAVDVVYYGNAAEPRATTQIVVLRGSTDKAEQVRAVLGAGRISVALDSSRLLDVSVYLGRDFSFPLNFHP